MLGAGLNTLCELWPDPKRDGRVRLQTGKLGMMIDAVRGAIIDQKKPARQLLAQSKE